MPSSCTPSASAACLRPQASLILLHLPCPVVSHPAPPCATPTTSCGCTRRARTRTSHCTIQPTLVAVLPPVRACRVVSYRIASCRRAIVPSCRLVSYRYRSLHVGTGTHAPDQHSTARDASFHMLVRCTPPASPIDPPSTLYAFAAAMLLRCTSSSQRLLLPYSILLQICRTKRRVPRAQIVRSPPPVVSYARLPVRHPCRQRWHKATPGAVVPSVPRAVVARDTTHACRV